MLACICAAVPSNSRPQPIANSVSPTKTMRARPADMIGDMAGGVGRHLHHLGLILAEADQVALGDRAVERRDARGLRRRAR